MTAANPSVNRSLADQAMGHIDHALGRPLKPLHISHRNNFAVDRGSDLDVAFSASPHWRLVAMAETMAFYAVTDEGRWALHLHLLENSDIKGWLIRFDGYERVVPASTAGKAKYAYYLEVSDSWSELRFGDFARRATVRRAA